MIDGIYFIEVDTPLGRKSGTVELTTHGEVLEARVKAPIIGKQESTGVVKGNTFTAQGELKIPLKGKVKYSLEGEVDEDGVVVAKFVTGRGEFIIFGARMS